jgi:hypothetical protein
MMLQGEKKGWSLALSHLALLESRSLDMLAAVADQVITARIAHLYSSPIIEFIIGIFLPTISFYFCKFLSFFVTSHLLANVGMFVRFFSRIKVNKSFQ